jgi:hypothetical protein
LVCSLARTGHERATSFTPRYTVASHIDHVITRRGLLGFIIAVSARRGGRPMGGKRRAREEENVGSVQRIHGGRVTGLRDPRGMEL